MKSNGDTEPLSVSFHTFFRKFDQLSEAPNAVGKIRELERALGGKVEG